MLHSNPLGLRQHTRTQLDFIGALAFLLASHLYFFTSASEPAPNVVQLPQCDVSPSAPELDPDTRVEDQLQFNDFWNIGDDFGSLDDDFGAAGESLEEKYEGAGACYSKNGLTFLDVFNADEYAEYRKDNLLYPFASKEEWEVAGYLLRSSLSMAAIDEFLKLRMIQNLQLSFSNARELRSCAEMLPSGPSWKCQTIPSIHPTKLPICLFWRDPIECLESLFSNPLFHDKLDFIPRRVYKMAARLLRVYSEWLTGNSAWDMQSQYPRGATILGTVLSSNKTNITTMTGARIAHPLLLGLANICMCTRTKLSSKAFMLTALLPIPKYLHPNQWMHGMLEDRLVHECLLVVLKPLMIAAEVGIMMSDLVGNVQHCFTPLAVYIVDTPEAAMLACVRGKTSPFTMASYLQFGDHFRHPAHTCVITLAQLASITVDPNDLEAYFEACAEHRLNGVHAPFWEGFPHADPSIFLTPEPLHHWHKEFYDHDLQWCLKVVGAQELDFRFSILQPITGYRHFAGGISKLKQVTGRVHCDIQRYIVGLISGVAPRCFVIAIHALMDVRYLAQCPAPDDDLLSCIDQSLLTFHENKNIIMTLGARMGVKKPIDNWFIPKLELLQSIMSSTRKVGALIQWSADATEHAHICRHLDRKEKLRHFAIATTLKSHDLDCSPVDVAEENEGEEDNIDYDEQEPSDPRTALLKEMNHTRITTNYFSKAKRFATLSRRELAYPPRTFIGGTIAIHLNYDPSRGGVKVEDISVDYNIPDLHIALSDFLQRDARGRGVVHEVASRRRPLIDCAPILPFDRVQVWHSVRLQQTSFHDSSIILPAQTIHASPSGPGWPKGR
ncbi:uncharacterized protein HD556DRAFT_1449075 [Suillus plorans]|uniref:DUF6830 domain-containing protein n=1 Tax=Suillus plorans TaxID=116603 RepID=A0A9P7DCS1_9AGAM|nr:uncharacterized protein HD556DRAFT_1449075 [Suillus plorans]KAG1787146.1 hypothetical protein HD556DRAFT_1449075 [Suillus plorans]